MNTNQKIRDTQGVSRIFWLVCHWARRSGAEEAIEAVTAYRDEGGQTWTKGIKKDRQYRLAVKQ